MAVRGRHAALVVVLTLTAALMSPVGAHAAGDQPGPDWTVLGRCGDFTHSVVTLTEQGFTVHDPSGYDWDQSALSPAVWQAPTGDAVRHLHLYGLTWISPLLRLLQQEPDTARLDALVVAVASTTLWRPDNGLRLDPVWNEGAVLRREQATNCLYELTRDERLVGPLLALVRAGSDPVRYYGPPNKLPHNHGLMSNLALIETARLLGREDIRVFAVRRLAVALEGAFTRAGVSIEQSTFYHLDNILSWSKAEQILRGQGTPDALAVAGRIAAVLVRARSALAHLSDPSGRPVAWGDGVASAVRVVRQRLLTFGDAEAGVLTGRWRWSSTTDFYGVRFGGPRRMHGHEDRMSVVWWARGVPVLADTGTVTYVPGKGRDWTIAPTSHPSAVVSRRVFLPRQGIALTRWTRSGAVHGVVLRGKPYGVDQVRGIKVDSVRHALTLDDRVAAGALVQVLQLDTRWTLIAVGTNGRTAVFRDGAGHRLQLSTTGRVASVRRGGPGLAGGWTFTYPPTAATAAARVLVTGGAHLFTSLRVVDGA